MERPDAIWFGFGDHGRNGIIDVTVSSPWSATFMASGVINKLPQDLMNKREGDKRTQYASDAFLPLRGEEFFPAGLECFGVAGYGFMRLWGKLKELMVSSSAAFRDVVYHVLLIQTRAL